MDLHRIRYRGDKKDVELLFRDYNLEGIISTSEERQKLEESNFRNQLLKDGAFLLSEPISPRIFNIVAETKQKLGLEGKYEVFCLNSNSINAFAYVQPAEEKNFFIICITSAALEELEDTEERFGSLMAIKLPPVARMPFWAWVMTVLATVVVPVEFWLIP